MPTCTRDARLAGLLSSRLFIVIVEVMVVEQAGQRSPWRAVRPSPRSLPPAPINMHRDIPLDDQETSSIKSLCLPHCHTFKEF
jgi:hypothetical protein